MKSAVIQFPGSNRDRDMIQALTLISGHRPDVIWHRETEISKFDLIVIPGGFSYGDYLRAGAIAARSPIMATVQRMAEQGVPILGVCNGFQILTEIGLLPGALMRNQSLNFVCKQVQLSVENSQTPFTNRYATGSVFNCPVAHHDGNYFADDETLEELENSGQIVFRYANQSNPNGSLNDIAGICNSGRSILGMMPHPENYVEPLHGGTAGRPLFESLLHALN
jgi:phosphoribosylformylglycinamidine synthase I